MLFVTLSGKGRLSDSLRAIPEMPHALADAFALALAVPAGYRPC
jgi:hypothetical protein